MRGLRSSVRPAHGIARSGCAGDLPATRGAALPWTKRMVREIASAERLGRCPRRMGVQSTRLVRLRTQGERQEGP